MKKTLFVPVLAMAAALSVSCSKEETEGVENGPVNGGEAALFAPQSVISASSAATKTALDGVNINWEEGDAITLFGKDGASVKYTLTEGAGATVGTFEAEGELPAQVQAYAVYPAVAEGVTLNEDKVAVSVAAEQTYNAADFPAEYPMAAVTSDGQNFTFGNLATVVSLSLKGDATVKTVSIEAVGGEKLAGAAAIDFAAEGAPVLKADAEASSIVTLSCGDGVQLTAEGVTFNFVVIPGIFSQGFKVTVSGDESTIMEKSTPAEPMTLNAGTIAKFSPMSATPMGWNLVGSFIANDWSEWINMLDAGSMHYALGVDIPELDSSNNNDGFKIRYGEDSWFGTDDSGINVNTGIENIISTSKGKNIIVPEGKYDIYVDDYSYDNKRLLVMPEGTSPFSVCWGYDGQDGATDIEMQIENGYFVAKNVEFAQKAWFKIRFTGDWNKGYNFGFENQAPAALATELIVTNGVSGNLQLEAGIYDIYFDTTRVDNNESKMTVWVMAPGQTPADAIAE